MPERVILSIGTKKGVFVAEAPKTRRSFSLRGPHGSGVGVYATLIDTRATPRLYASSCNAFFGMKVLVSTDLLQHAALPAHLKAEKLPTLTVRGRSAPLGIAALSRA